MKNGGTVNFWVLFWWKMSIAGVTFAYRHIHFLQLFRQSKAQCDSIQSLYLLQDPCHLYKHSLLDCMALRAMRGEYSSLLLCIHYNKKNDLQTFG